MLRMFVSLLTASTLLLVTDGHGAVVNPPPRNAVDRNLKPWNGTVPVHPPSVESKTGWCPVPGPDGKPSGQNGQSCFWFSNGCALGCDTCDGVSRGPIPTSKDPYWHRKFNLCNVTEEVATICDPALRTVNTGVECGADDDWYYYSPWRAPGLAPVFDSCGVAGGHDPPQGGFGGIYVTTPNAKLGDRGTKVLPKRPTGTVWYTGVAYEVTWTIEANHGGGYQYRLCPANQTLDEECFQKTPLEFVGQQGLRWAGGPKHGGKEIFFHGTYVNVGTLPVGSTWVTNPIPRNDWTGKGFPPHCSNVTECQGMTDGQSSDPFLEIVDQVLIPENLHAGEYVLGWRWDCEESNQIWMSCSDVTIKIK